MEFDSEPLDSESNNETDNEIDDEVLKIRFKLLLLKTFMRLFKIFLTYYY